MKLRIIAYFILAVFISACNDEFENTPSSLTPSEDYEILVDFSNALSIAIKENTQFRILLKEESLKKFNRDYDVLFATIKDQEIQPNFTVEDLFSQYLNNEKLQQINLRFPLLTIFIPKLPNNSFSPENWDAVNEIPKVALKQLNSNDVNIYDAEGNINVLESKYIPGFPVVVVKLNERVIASKNNNSRIKGHIIKTGNPNYIFSFLDSNFDPSQKISNKNSRIGGVEPEIIDSYNIYRNINGWHRDYIYYQITPTTPSGQFIYDFQEHITTFSLNGNPVALYSKISDQTGDPDLNIVVQKRHEPVPPENSGWTGGAYEFKFSIMINGKNGVGPEIIKYVHIAPTELFEIDYFESGGFFTAYFPVIVGLRETEINLPLFSWNLNDYATTIKIAVEEVDNTESIETTYQQSVEFATNFGLEGEILKKIGLKFGASNKMNKSMSTKHTITVGSDPLGESLINFGDDIIIRSIGGDQFETRTYSTGECKFSVEPKRVQGF